MWQSKGSTVRLIAAVGVIAALAGCQKPPEPAPASSSSSASPEPKPEPPHLPARQSGLWDFTISEQGSADTPRRFKVCIDAETDKQLGVVGKDLSADKCFKHAVSLNPDNSWNLVAECNMGTGGVDTFSGTITGDYSKSYTMNLRVQTNGASLAQMNRVSNLTIIAKRTGTCSGDLKAGDMVESGVTVNLFDMAGKTHK
jgi:hypothetical protein